MDFQSVQDWQQNELSKAEYGRMPWHDVAMGVMGDCVYDIAEHFVLRWNFIKRDKYKRDHGVDWLMLEGRTGEDEDLVGVQRPKYPCGDYVQHPLKPLETKPLGKQGFARAQIVRSSADWSSGILPEHSIQNAYKEVISQAQHFVYIENQFFSEITPLDLVSFLHILIVSSHGYWRPAEAHPEHNRAVNRRCSRPSGQGRKEVSRDHRHPRYSRIRRRSPTKRRDRHTRDHGLPVQVDSSRRALHFRADLCSGCRPET